MLLYPWQNTNWQQITGQWETKPNAWLLTGKSKIGKGAFARYLAQALLCESPNQDHTPCQNCLSCHLVNENTHPDLKVLSPDGAEEEITGSRKLLQIKVEAVRDAIEFSQLSAHRGGYRVLLIDPAESLNTQAANALLKVLEEPSNGVIFILVASQKDKLLPTIKSRCRIFPLTAPSQEEALDYLALQQTENAQSLLAFYGGAPLFEDTPEQDEIRQQLLAILLNPTVTTFLDFATKFDQKKWALSVFLNWIQKWVVDLVWVRHYNQVYFYPEYGEGLKKKGESVNLIKSFEFLDQLNKLVPYGQHTLNVKLQIESILIDYLELVRS